MRRLLLACLLVLVVGVPLATGTARAASTVQILRDCGDDDQLEGTYSLADLQKARKNIGADQDEYSACRDVLARAISAAAAKENNQRSGSSTSGSSATATPSGAGNGASGSGGSGSTSGSTDDSGSGGGSGTTDGPDQQQEAAVPTPAPVTAAELNAAAQAAQKAGRPSVTVDGRRVLAGSSGLAPDAVVNSLPTSLLVVLILLVATGVAAILPFLRRRVLRRHRPE